MGAVASWFGGYLDEIIDDSSSGLGGTYPKHNPLKLGATRFRAARGFESA